MTIDIRASQDCYVHVINILANDSLLVLYPNRYMRYDRLPANSILHLMPAGFSLQVCLLPKNGIEAYGLIHLKEGVMFINIYFNMRKFLLIKFTLLFLGVVPAMSQESAEPLFSTEYKPGFYTSFALFGYQARSFSVDFSKIKYRTSGTGMMLSYISRNGGLNLNFFGRLRTAT